MAERGYMDATRLILSFADLSKNDVAQAGGKGASLGELTRAGFPVPPGFVVAAEAFQTFLDECGLTQTISKTLATLSAEDAVDVSKAAEALQAFILNEELPKDLAHTIQKAHTDLGATFVAVRSSATAEDSAANSWAGELETYLNTTSATLLENVRKCWASLFTSRAVFYRLERGLGATDVSVAVVIQKMVASDAAGVAFSVHPVTKDVSTMVIEGGWGLGEAVVSGSITPDTYVVKKEDGSVLSESISEQTEWAVRGPEGGVRMEPVPMEKQSQRKLTPAQLQDLADVTKRIEEHYGKPMDIEWAIENNVLYLTQARPITAL